MAQQKMSNTKAANALETAVELIKRYPDDHTLLFLLTDGKIED